MSVKVSFARNISKDVLISVPFDGYCKSFFFFHVFYDIKYSQ